MTGALRDQDVLRCVWEADALRRLKQRTDTTRIAKPVQAEAAISLGPYYFLHDQQILLFLLFLTKGILLSARFRGRCVEPGVRDSRVVPVAVVRRTLWHKEQNFASRNFAKRGTRYLQVCGRGQKVTEFSPDIHYRSLFLTVFFAYLHCSARSTWSKRALSKKKMDIIEQDWARSGGRRVPVLDLENVCQPASSSENRSRH